MDSNRELLRALALNSGFLPTSSTTPKAAKVARKPKVSGLGQVSAPSRSRSARLVNKKTGTKAPEIATDVQGTLDNDDQPSSDDEHSSQVAATEDPPARTRIDFVYQATSEKKDICTRFADGRVDDHLLEIIAHLNPDKAGEPGLPSPAFEETPTTNLPRVATEDLVGNAAVAPESIVPTSPAKTKTKLKGKAKHIAKAKRFGDVKVAVGTWCARRGDFHDNLVHLPTMAGIFGDPDKGAYSVAVSGGYEDNVDGGDSFTFTGEGGKIVDKRKKRGSLCKTAPNAPQSLTKGNMALYRSCQTGKAVRVIRGENSSWDGAPKKGYRYDGVSVVLPTPPEDI